MATQSLYRRYRPRRFSELKGQEHVVRALRTSVAEGREGQAYLFSGPRGTGKTTSARILAKVLNCENPQDGEPCCECDSCLAVERGTSYDVHELDAASNNGVDAMRDLIEKASLGTPGRHKVYILDEVHMLSPAASAALLKTLEEPPPHVVFVLATTDPQKMSDTIRSRTQHLQFHLLPVDTLEQHVKWVASEAGLEVTDAGIAQVLEQGAGSARDTLSALELVANTGGDADEIVSLDEFIEAMIDHDPGRALTMAAQAISRGRDPRTLTEELIRELRNGFLSLMAPDVVQVPSARLEVLSDQARRLGPPGLVRGIERLGAALTDMRHAPDPRVLLDVAVVQLTSEEVGGDVGALAERLTRLERKVADGVPAGSGGGAAPAAAPTTAAAAADADPAPADPATGRKALGGRVKRAAAPAAADEMPADGAPPPVEAAQAAETPATDPPAAETPAAETPAAETVSAPAPADDSPAPSVAPEPAPAASEPADSVPATPAGGAPTATQWDEVRGGLKGMARAVFSPAEMVGSEPGSITLRLPNDTHRQKCEQHRPAVEQALAAVLGGPVSVELVTGDGGGPGGGPGGGGGAGSGGGGAPAARPAQIEPASEQPSPSEPAGRPMAAGSVAAVASVAARLADDADETPHLQSVPESVAEPDAAPAAGRAIAEAARAGEMPDPDADPVVADTAAYAELPDDDDVDLDDLVDAPPEAVKTPMDRLAEAFPGSELVDDVY